MNCRPRCRAKTSEIENDNAGCWRLGLSSASGLVDFVSSTGNPTRFSVTSSRRIVFSLTAVLLSHFPYVCTIAASAQRRQSIHCRSSVGVSGMELSSCKACWSYGRGTIDQSAGIAVSNSQSSCLKGRPGRSIAVAVDRSCPT